jgi:hypothetical protein
MPHYKQESRTKWNRNMQQETMTAFWDTAPCRVIKYGRRFRRTYYLHHQGVLMMEAVVLTIYI